MQKQQIYQIYAQLKDYEPITFRRILVPHDILFADLAYILMICFEMDGSHLFNFNIPDGENQYQIIRKKKNLENRDEIIKQYKGEAKKRTVIVTPETDELIDFNFTTQSNILPITRVSVFKTTLDSYITNVGNKFTFTYDFGDDWTIDLKLEKIIRTSEFTEDDLPVVVDGAGYGIIEDCGGVFSLMDLHRAFKEKKGDDYKIFSEWLEVKSLEKIDKHLADDIFDINLANKRLVTDINIYMKIYER